MSRCAGGAGSTSDARLREGALPERADERESLAGPMRPRYNRFLWELAGYE
jgi:hypothetical protein